MATRRTLCPAWTSQMYIASGARTGLFRSLAVLAVLALAFMQRGPGTKDTEQLVTLED